ncbi:hypothetical protein BD410DRAFT_790540 [Rickenella mellea]|uniref:Uncharacterized protein n=1 Tax=Rickenella mellea TaxID=50990 RepID=A0A4Y7Q1W6_9AGAM|nr:hypothetical protein BD410DRAFT_790540 [Rickenella mellea]
MGGTPLSDYHFYALFHQRRCWRIALPLEAMLAEFAARTNVSAYYAENYAVRIWLFSASLKHRLQDMDIGGPVKNVKRGKQTHIHREGSECASGCGSDAKPAGSGGDEAPDAREIDHEKMARRKLRSDEIVWWAADATISVESPHDTLIDMNAGEHEHSQPSLTPTSPPLSFRLLFRILRIGNSDRR